MCPSGDPLKELLQYWPVLLVILQVATVVITWWLKDLAEREVERKVKVERDRIAVLEGRMSTADNHILDLTKDVENLPTKADIARLEGEVRGVGREVLAANAGIERIEGYFIARGVERT